MLWYQTIYLLTNMQSSLLRLIILSFWILFLFFFLCVFLYLILAKFLKIFWSFRLNYLCISIYLLLLLWQWISVFVAAWITFLFKVTENVKLVALFFRWFRRCIANFLAGTKCLLVEHIKLIILGGLFLNLLISLINAKGIFLWRILFNWGIRESKASHDIIKGMILIA